MSEDSDYRLVIKDGAAAGETFVLESASIVLGRDESADWKVEASTVSRKHARFIKKGIQYFVEDIGSSNGTFLNGNKINELLPLKNGDEIGLGKSLTLTFHMPAPKASSTDTVMEFVAPVGATVMESAFDPSATMAEVDDSTKIQQVLRSKPAPVSDDQTRIEIAINGGKPTVHALTKETITVGRTTDNQIAINSRVISRKHINLMRDKDGYRLFVLESAGNPVLKSGQPLGTPYRLQHDELLRIGRNDDNYITLRYLTSAKEAASMRTLTPDTAGTIVSKKSPLATPKKPEKKPMPSHIGSGAQTMIASDFKLPDMPTNAPIILEVAIAGDKAKAHRLTKSRITIGRAPESDIVIPSRIVSRLHATLERVGDHYRVVPTGGAGNPVMYNGRPVESGQMLTHDDRLRIGGQDPGLMVTMTYLSSAEAAAISERRTIDFSEKTIITVGRDDSNDVTVDSPVVSRYHAQIERVGQRYRVRDLRSANGTFVNGKSIEGEVWLQESDSVRIGSFSFKFSRNQLAQIDSGAGLRVEATNLNKWVRKDLNILNDISLVFEPRDFIVVVGQSGGGKSTLLDSIAGYRPATHGKVLVNDINVYENFDAIRNDIGYVPQKDIIHMELTAYQALDYSAQMRMPRDTTKEERHKRVMEVLEDLDIAHRKDTQISALSGGQQKRVSIGVELLTKPGLFFLDEPTSGLDPGTETSFMQLMRRLADQGRTIILVTHATKNVMLADKVVFLARGGHLAWFGPPDEALTNFNEYRTVREQRAHNIEFDEIYKILGDENRGNPIEWGERYKESKYYQKYVVQPLQEQDKAPVESSQAPATQTQIANRPKKSKVKQVGGVRQFSILSKRNVKILTRDKFGMALMLLVAPIVSLLDVVLAAVLGRDPLSFTDGFMPNVLITLFLPTVYGVMVAGLSQMREIVKEAEIYKRERLVNLRLLPYIMSKVWVAALLAIYQAAVYSIVHYTAFTMPTGIGSFDFLLFFFSLALATMAGMMLGLFSSVLAPNANTAPLLVIMLMLPQIVLGGALVPIPSPVSAPTSTRWAFQALMAISGSGSDVAQDACWTSLDDDARDQLDVAYKDSNCNCMGNNALDQDSCNFPGSGKFVAAEVEVTDCGVEPAEPGDAPARPASPELPPKPTPCEDESDTLCVADYTKAIGVWEEEADAINTSFQSEMDVYEDVLSQYTDTVGVYQDDIIEYKQCTATSEFESQAAEQGAIVPAEQQIAQFQRDFGWTFVDKEDTGAFMGTLVKTWMAQGLIIGVLFVLILIIQKRKDVI